MSVSTYTDDEFLKKYEKRAKIHKLVPFKKIVELLGDIRKKHILDLGCGTGDLTQELSKKGAVMVGADKSQKWIDFCKNRYGSQKDLSFELADGVNLSKFKTAAFDAVTMNMVLLNVDTIDEIGKIFKEISRVLKPEGMFIFSDLHPILKMTPKNVNRTQTNLPGFSYFKDGSQLTAKIDLDSGGFIEFTNRHWTLETLTRLLGEAGLCITRISEPTYEKDAPGRLKEFTIPEYILFVCKKSLK
jgi:ubiquinone/menaquinone biosynthesis C-methylase UbiE